MTYQNWIFISGYAIIQQKMKKKNKLRKNLLLMTCNLIQFVSGVCKTNSNYCMFNMLQAGKSHEHRSHYDPWSWSTNGSFFSCEQDLWISTLMVKSSMTNFVKWNLKLSWMNEYIAWRTFLLTNKTSVFGANSNELVPYVKSKVYISSCYNFYAVWIAMIAKNVGS